MFGRNIYKKEYSCFSLMIQKRLQNCEYTSHNTYVFTDLFWEYNILVLKLVLLQIDGIVKYR